MSIDPRYYNEDVKRIDKIEFTIFKNKDVKKYSVVSDDPFGINLAESYENYEPKKGGLVDLRLGTCDIYLPCTTCGENSIDCPGHFGHTDLAESVFHYGFLTHLKNILQCICHNCSKILVEKLDKKILNKKMELRYKDIKLLTKTVNTCWNCNTPVYKIKIEKSTSFIKISIEKNLSNNDLLADKNINKVKSSLTPRDCYNILRNVSDEDCKYLGFDVEIQRPEDLILDKFPIPPVIIRPTAKVDFMSSATMEDSLTLKISDIITTNKKVKQQIEKESVLTDISNYLQDIKALLQYHVTVYYDNETLALFRAEFKTGGRPLKSISERIKGKEGVVRKHLMGKRVNYSGRTVISSDPYVDIDQVGIPKKIAMELTIPEIATNNNIKYLSALVKNGRNNYPGANFVYKTSYRNGKIDIQKIDLLHNKNQIKLNYGDIVERHCINDDYVLFNRQPTLHKPSMMGHKIQVIDNDSLNTFRMNVSICAPYNADFDGDEMNIHLAQSIQARNELKRIANVQYQIVGAKNSSPIIGCQQDTITGAYVLTNDKSKKYYGYEIANLLCNTTSKSKYLIKMNELYTGHQVFSYIIPDGINLIKKSDKLLIEIINGNLKNGYLDNSLLGPKKNSIIHFIWDKYGPNKTKHFIDDAQRLIINFLLYQGQSVGIKDTIIDDDMNNKINNYINTAILKSKYDITQYENDNNQQFNIYKIEEKLKNDLDIIQANIGSMLISYLDKDNFFHLCVNSGAKGSSANIAQISGVVGAFTIGGERIKKNIEGRTQIYFPKNDDTPEARGFIMNSFLSGLKGYEFFISVTGCRDGLIDTAIKSVTWETPIIIIDNLKVKYIRIGEWIDNLIENNKDNVKHYTEKEMELLDINNVYIPTTDENGVVSWGEISAITRHDPGNQLYEIKTLSGRKVTVTESKSLLIWNKEENKLIETLTPEIKIGDKLPTTYQLPEPLNIHNNNNYNEVFYFLLGLFLGNGNIHYYKIIIINITNDIFDIVKNILDEMNIDYKYNNNQLISIDTQLLSIFNNINNFITQLQLYNNNYIKSFLNGLLLTNKCNIINNELIINVSNEQLMNELSMLFSRLGIFVNLNENKNIYTIKIFNNWLELLLNIFKLFDIKSFIQFDIENIKNNNIENINNIILDEIIEINLIDIINHPKVYDLTIPNTFNFCLANGLQVRDTAQTGYIQRQLIKGLEDLTIRYDGTNRNAKNIIIQNVYGENGLDQSKQSLLQLNIINMNNIQIQENFSFNSEQITKISKKLKITIKELTDFNKNYLNKLINLRNELRIIQQKALINYKNIEDNYMVPVNLFRITQDYLNYDNNEIELNPIEIEQTINNFLTNYNNRIITSLKTTDVFMKEDDEHVKFLLKISLYEYLAPYKCIYIYKLTKEKFTNMMKEITLNFHKSIIEPGEMVGIIAAQSIGEPTSQLSVCAHSKIKLIIKNKITNNIDFISNNIGVFCDSLINKYPELTFNTEHVNSIETDLNNLDNEYYIVGVDKYEKINWNKISHISRHSVNGNMMKVVTKSGRIVHTTTSHSHLIRRNQTVEPIVGTDMKIGMRIPVAKYINNIYIKEYIEINNINYKLDFSFGWFIGIYLSNGYINNNNIFIKNISTQFITNIELFIQKFDKNIIITKTKTKNNNLTINFNIKLLNNFIIEYCNTKSIIPDFIFLSPNDCKAGLIQSYFDINSHINTKYKITICNNSEQFIKDISLLLNYFDIFCNIKYIKISNNYKLIISKKYILLYKNYIGSLINNNLNISNKLNIEYDNIDKINGLGEIINICGKKLKLNNYNKWKNIDSIGRSTLKKYIKIFESNEYNYEITSELKILNQAANSNVIWDEIISIDIYIPDQKNYVYDFTVPLNQTFMIDNGIIVHNTLNTKHFSGTAKGSSVIKGVPRILELLHYSKNIKTPEMIIYFKEPYNTNLNQLNKIISHFKFLSIKDLINSIDVYYDLGGNDELSKKIKNDNVSNPFFINNQKTDILSLPFVFRFSMNIEKMLNKEITLLDIKTKFISHWYKNYNNIKNLKKNEKDIITKINRCAILSNNILDNEQIIHIRFNMISFNYSIIIEFLRIIIEDITLKGIENITNYNQAYERKISFNNETGDIIIDKEYVVYTNGINLDKIKLFKGVDLSRTKTNDINSVLKSYGIEAARQIIIHELVIAFGENGINHNHLSVLVDQMCYTGEIIAMDRHGLSKIDIDPIARASFEKQMEHFINAAMFNEKDNLSSVSSRIALGKVINGGTGCFDIILDTKKLENSEYTEDETSGRITFIPLEEEPLLQDIIINYNGKTNFFIPT